MCKTAAPLLLALAAACTETEIPPSATVRDSAGVRIVEQGALERLSRTTMGPSPAFELGWTAGSVSFSNVPAGALFGDGSSVVFDEGAQALYFISADGRDVAQAGRAGEGPGEFRAGSAITILAGDTVVIYDPTLSRLSRLGTIYLTQRH
jgi:hypothetical protein